ncbi:MAG: pyruvate kinase, partial [Bacteroidales bacterium]|nr:pyruvate kinase [Bacteroidales bacterium]
IGPASSSYETLKTMAASGMDVCRLNFSHGDFADHQEVIDNINRLNKETGSYVALLADLQGPKIRLGDFEEEAIVLKAGERINFVCEEVLGNKQRISIRYNSFARDVKPGDQVLVDDGKIALKVIETNSENSVLLEAQGYARLLPRKGVNLPDTQISLPSLTPKDCNDLEFMLDKSVQWIALSFVRSAVDINRLREIIDAHPGKEKPGIIAKIEKPQALENIEDIIEAADGVMIARGDLGVEIPMEQVPMIQKKITTLCQQKGKPVIVATQMMESMMTSTRPTRAEVSDVANSVLDGADALMLSGETSVGNYPIETVQTMQQIIHQIEDYDGIYYRHTKPKNFDNPRFVSDSVLFAASNMAQSTSAKAIIVVTHSGYSATKLAGHRPKAMLYVFSGSDFVLKKINLLWGVNGFYDNSLEDADKLIEHLNAKLKNVGLLKAGDDIIHVLSTPVWSHGRSNTVRLGSVD